MSPAHGLLRPDPVASRPPPTDEATILQLPVVLPGTGPVDWVVPEALVSQKLLPAPTEGLAMYSSAYHIAEGSLIPTPISTLAVLRTMRGSLSKVLKSNSKLPTLCQSAFAVFPAQVAKTRWYPPSPAPATVFLATTNT